MELLPLVLKEHRRRSIVGQSIIELLVALSVLMMVLLSLVSVAALSVRNSDYTKKKSRATQYSQQGLENIRALRDSVEWTEFVESYTDGVNGNYWGLAATDVVPNGPCPSTPNLPSSNPIFIRCVRFQFIPSVPPQPSPPYPGSIVKVHVTVKWDDLIGTHISSASSQFTDKAVWQ